MKFESSANSQEQIKPEQFLQNPAFQRFSAGFELYQEILQDQSHIKDYDNIKQRMHDLYKGSLNESQLNDSETEDMRLIKQELSPTLSAVIKSCEEGKFSSDELANILISKKIGRLFLEEWTRKGGEVDEMTGMKYLNSLVAYQEDSKDAISIHMRPTGTESSAILWELINGLHTLKEKLISGEIAAKEIKMKSWLFSGSIGEKAKRLFGDINIENVHDESDNDTLAAQHLALQFNTKSLKKYLETGEKPLIKEATMSADEFIRAIK